MKISQSINDRLLNTPILPELIFITIWVLWYDVFYRYIKSVVGTYYNQTFLTIFNRILYTCGGHNYCVHKNILFEYRLYLLLHRHTQNHTQCLEHLQKKLLRSYIFFYFFFYRVFNTEL